MEQTLLELTETFLQYQKDLEAMQFWQPYRVVFPISAYIHMVRGYQPDRERFLRCRQALELSFGIFSSFRGSGKLIYTSLLATTPRPKDTLTRTTMAYESLRQYYRTSMHLPTLAFLFAQTFRKGHYDEYARKSYEIYRAMKQEHLFLTQSEDVVYSGLLALTDRDIEDIMVEIEESYFYLKKSLRRRKDVLQSVSHALTLCYGDPDKKCQNLLNLMSALKENGITYGRGFEVVSLAILANMQIEPKVIVRDFLEVDSHLRQLKQYGFFGLSKSMRYMHVVMILSCYYMAGSYELSAAFLVASIMEIQRQQAATAAAAAA